MALSPNYGWAEPDNSSLVKNGAQDIRALGDAIDTSVWNIGFGQAGKNKVINGDFGIWQRGTSLTATNAFFYTADRWLSYSYGASATTVSQQTFTPGAAPVAGYEGQYFLRVTSSTTQIYLEQRIEDVRTFAGQTVTFSFWAKQATAAATSLGTTLVQVFGTGGSTQVNTTIISGQSTTTGWTRYSGTATLPSITGKTIGTNSYLAIQMSNGSLNNALDVWGVQLEYGSKATPFETASGTLQGELALCQRYYIRFQGASFEQIGMGFGSDTVYAVISTPLPVPLRTAPSAIEFSTLRISDTQNVATVSSITFPTNQTSSSRPQLKVACGSSITQYRPYLMEVNNSTSGYLALTAEL